MLTYMESAVHLMPTTCSGNQIKKMVYELQGDESISKVES